MGMRMAYLLGNVDIQQLDRRMSLLFASKMSKNNKSLAEMTTRKWATNADTNTKWTKQNNEQKLQRMCY